MVHPGVALQDDPKLAGLNKDMHGTGLNKDMQSLSGGAFNQRSVPYLGTCYLGVYRRGLTFFERRRVRPKARIPSKACLTCLRPVQAVWHQTAIRR